MEKTNVVMSIWCGCGAQLNVRLLSRSGYGTGRYGAICKVCGRVLRTDFPEQIVSIEPVEREPQNIRIGPAFNWKSTVPGEPTSPESAIAFHVDGMPEYLKADLVPGFPLGNWRFVVHSEFGTFYNMWFCKSKEHALEDLKIWLQENGSLTDSRVGIGR